MTNQLDRSRSIDLPSLLSRCRAFGSCMHGQRTAANLRPDNESRGHHMRLILHLLAGLLSALGVIAVGFFCHDIMRPFFSIVWTPAIWIVHLSDVICPPKGVRCFLGSESQGAHHLW